MANASSVTYVLTSLRYVEDAAISYTLAAVVCIILIAAVMTNVLVFVTFARTRRLQRPYNYPILNLAVADIIAAVFWVLPTVQPAVDWHWSLGGGICQLQGFAATLCFALNTHTMLFVSGERFLSVWRPTKHREVFSRTATLLLLSSIWVLDLVVALFPVMGWGKLVYVPSQLQCAFDHSKSASHLSFTFVVIFAIPFLLIATLYGYSLISVSYLRRRTGSGGPMVLEKNQNARAETYADKYRRQEKQMTAAKKPAVVGPTKTTAAPDPGASSGDSSDENGNDDTVTSYADWAVQQRDRCYLKKRLRVFKTRDFRTLVTMFVTSLIYAALWLPYMVVNYVWTFQPGSVTAQMYTAVAFVAFLGTAYKPFVYATNVHFRHALKRAVQQNE